MSIDNAFSIAARDLGGLTVCGEAPKPLVRVKALEACRDCVREAWRKTFDLPTRHQLRRAAMARVGFGPLTWLWVAVMVARLLAALRALLNQEADE